MELLLGCGNARRRRIAVDEREGWQHLVTLDIDPGCKPDVVHDLECLPLPFGDDTFDEVHAYEVLEHVGSQGDWRFFFAQFSDLWRILKPDGVLAGTTPNWASPWSWGDPGHTRIIGTECMTFLNQAEYAKQVGNGPMTDYRHVYKADFQPIYAKCVAGTNVFALRAVKPSRIAEV